MNSIYSIDEEINFSDDDDNFLLQLDANEKENININKTANSVIVTEKPIKESSSHNLISKSNNFGSTTSTIVHTNLSQPVDVNTKSDLEIIHHSTTKTSKKSFSFCNTPNKSNNKNTILESFFNDDELGDIFDSEEDILENNIIKPTVKNNDSFNSSKNPIISGTPVTLSHSFNGTIRKNISSLSVDVLKIKENAMNSLTCNDENNFTSSSRQNKISERINTNTLMSAVSQREVHQSNLSSPSTVNHNLLKRTHKEKLTESTTSNKRQAKQRRFPGPAGALPKLKSTRQLDTLKSPEMSKDKRSITPLTPKTPVQTFKDFSQDDDFSSQIWKNIKFEMIKSPPNQIPQRISTVLKNASNNKLDNGKVSLIYGLVKTFSITGTSGKLVLKDPSGEINGSVHRHVLEEYEAVLKQGSGLILKDVSIYSPNSKKHYINITPSNIVKIIANDSNDIPLTQSQTQSIGKENTASEIRMFYHNEATDKFENLFDNDDEIF